MARYPLFDLFTLDEISRRTGYSIGYLEDVRKRAGRPLSRTFRLVCADGLKRSQEELFGPTSSESPAIPHDAMQELADTTNARVARKNERVRAKFTALQGGQP